MTEASGPFDPERILATLGEHGVEYLVIGGVAAQTHGRRRMTADIDLIPAPGPDNLNRLAEALRAIDAKVLDPRFEDFEVTADLLPRATIWQFSTAAGGIDVIHEAPGARPYDELREAALSISLDDLELKVAGLDDLIAMKLARGRPIDLEDVEALTNQA